MSDWEDGETPIVVPVSSSFNEEGRNYGKGRGYVPPKVNDDEWKDESQINFSTNNNSGEDYDSNKGWDSNYKKRDGFDSNRRGGGNFRGGKRDNNGDRFGRDSYSNKDKDDYSDRGYDEDTEDSGFKDNRGGRGGFRDSRGGRGGFNDRNGGGYKKREDQGDGDGNDGEEKSDKPPKMTYVPPEPSNDESEIYGTGVTAGINFAKYDDIPVKVSGENTPQPIENFEDAGLRKLVLENVKKSGYKKPTPVQKHAFPIILAKRDLMACAQTGSGKTAAFLVPMIHMLLETPREMTTTSSHTQPQVLIVSPTRELTIQIFQEARKFALNSVLKCTVVYGGTQTMHQVHKIEAGCDVLVATPGRLMDFVGRGRISFGSLRFLVLDEADRMLDMGFLPEIEKLMDHETMPAVGVRQTLMFSATFPEEVQRLAARFLKDYLFLAVGIVGGACADVEQTVYEVPKFSKLKKLKEIIENETKNKIERTLVFVETKRNADFLASYLSDQNFPTTSIHGDRLQKEREEALADFKGGKMPILVATAVAARGLDIRDVQHVLNYDLPKTIDEYVHRIGRTGRVGNKGRATSFYDPKMDEPIRGDLVKILTQAKQEIPDFLGHPSDGSFAPGRGSSFGGTDVRKFDNDNPMDTYSSSQAVEPEEEW